MLTDFRLKVFKTVADRLSFTKAAAELLISQPAVTKQINELERLLGKPLFLRHGNRISLTDDGVRLLEYANRILALYGELRDAFVEEQGAFSGEIRLGASTTLSQYVLPGLLAKFRKLYPDVRVTLFNGNTEQIERQIADGKLDFGMIEGTASNPALHYELFMDDELVLVTSASNTSFIREEITAADLPALPLVIRENGSGTLDVLSRELSRHGLSLRQLHIEMQLGSTESIKHYLFYSDTFAFVSVQAVLDELAANRLRVVEVGDMELVRRFSFVTAHGQRSRLTDLFKQFCLNHYNRKL
ncbi:LysR substrate-binding domain-containing protein [Alistipes indistinctus]|uniref:LysR substrate-binding domain-containing protein n=1 Tax=Alistipes indistinctus TaxID=626932 RepID=UPI00266E9929|nr:LysR substrate-binding domain-containing protein [Alistipes indistinctus]